jgi:pilus assembly protein CpaC
MKNLRRSRLSWILFGVVLLVSARAHADDTVGPMPPPAEQKIGSSASDGSAESAAAQAQSRTKKFKRSRLTSDESEGVADRRTVLMATGEDRAVDLDFEVNAGANGITVGNPKVVATTLVKIGDRRQMVFKPLSKGETNIVVRDNDGTIRLIFTVSVSDSNLLRRKAEIIDMIRDIDGLDVRVVGQRIVIDGEVIVPSDYARLFQVVSEEPYRGLVINLAQLSPLAMQVLAQRIKQDVNTFAPKVETRVVNGIIFLEGTVESADKAKRAFELAKIYLPEVKPGNPLARDPTAQQLPPRALVQNFILIDAPAPRKQDKLVRITVHFVELAKDYSKFFGFKWEPGFKSDPEISFGPQADGSTGASGTSLTGTISSLFPKLKSAQDAGFARVLKTGSVIVRSGKPAQMAEGVDYPYTKIGPNGQPVGESRQVKFSIAVTPQILGQSDDIQMDLDLTQESVVGEVTQGQAPTVSNHQVKTQLYIKSSESAAVAGVTSADVKTGFNKGDPNAGKFSGTTDPLFTLKHTKNFNKRKSQFVIFVTPQVVENASEGTEDLKKNFRIKVQ